MTIDGAAVAEEQYLRLMILGPPKIGKTHAAMATCEKRAYVIASDGPGGMQTAQGLTTDYDVDYVDAGDRSVMTQLDNALNTAERGVREGKYKTIIWDTVTAYSLLLSDLYVPPDKDSNWKSWQIVEARLRNPIQRLNRLKAHIIILAHSVITQEDGKVKKIYPQFPGKSARIIPGLMNDVVYMEKEGENRVFRVSMAGVEGPGSRNLPGVSTIPADVMGLIRLRGQTPRAPAQK